MTVSDLLRDSILNPESDAAELYKPEGKKEFLYDLFKLITTGGSMCQHEDNWEAYLSTVKARALVCVCAFRVFISFYPRLSASLQPQTMYKQLLSVVKNESGKMSIASVVVKVTNWEADTPLFPGDSPHNSCYVVVDPLKRTVSVVYSAFVPFW